MELKLKIFFVILCNIPRDMSEFTRRISGWLKENSWLDDEGPQNRQ